MSLEMTQEEAVAITHEIFEMDKLYILLSVKQANLLRGFSVPYMAQTKDGSKGVVFFSQEEYARQYIEENGIEILDGIYPIGVVEKSNKQNSIVTILGVAKALGASFLDYNTGTDCDALGCSIDWFAANNAISLDVSVLLSKEEFERTMENSKEGFPLRFNAIGILNFDGKYILGENESNKLLRILFEGYSMELYRTIFNKESLFECCHTMDYLCSQLIPRAHREEKGDTEEFLHQIEAVLESVVKEKIKEEKDLYTLADLETGKTVIRNNIGYILYTDRYKYMGKYQYIKVENDITDMLRKEGAKGAMVTDGPHGMALINL